MQDFTLGAGLAALAFWGFIASVVVAGIWFLERSTSFELNIRAIVFALTGIEIE